MLQPGDLGIDSAKALDPVQAAKDGAKFLVRYSAGAGNTSSVTQWKLCRPGEIAAAVAAGLDFVANSEWYETRITEGRRAGDEDGRADLAFWQSRGLAKGAAIKVSWDAAPVRNKYKRVRAYLNAYEKALGGYYTVTLPYAGTPFLRWASKRRFGKGRIGGWRSESPSFNNDGLPWQPNTHTPELRQALLVQGLKATPAVMWQTGNTWYGGDADENLVLRVPVGSHLEAQAGNKPAPPPPAPKPPTPPPPPVAPGADVILAEIEKLIAQLAQIVEGQK